VGGAYLGYNYFNGQTPMSYTTVNANADGFIQKYNVDLKISRDMMVYATASQGSARRREPDAGHPRLGPGLSGGLAVEL
jgi:hypothetical protein